MRSFRKDGDGKVFIHCTNFGLNYRKYEENFHINNENNFKGGNLKASANLELTAAKAKLPNYTWFA